MSLRVRKPWSEAELQLVERLYGSRTPPARIAQITGRSKASIETQMSRLRATYATAIEISSSAWDDATEAELRRLAALDLSHSQIAEQMGRTPGSISTKLSRLSVATVGSLPDPVRERIVEMSSEEGATPGRISRQLALSIETVTLVLKRAGVSPNALPSSYRGPEARRACR